MVKRKSSVKERKLSNSSKSFCGVTFATLIMLEQGVPIETVSTMLGHTNVSMTERYAKVTPQKLFEEFNHFLSFTEDLRLTI